MATDFTASITNNAGQKVYERDITTSTGLQEYLSAISGIYSATHNNGNCVWVFSLK